MPTACFLQGLLFVTILAGLIQYTHGFMTNKVSVSRTDCMSSNGLPSCTKLNVVLGDTNESLVKEEHNSKERSGISKSTDPEYPYQFTGRLWFSPSIVKLPDERMKKSLNKKSVDIISLFGYTLGGTVTLEYDTSPVGPYKEFVSMSSLVTKRSAIGQWGSRLYVSTQEAEDVCKDVWGVPAEVANIAFNEDNANGQSLLGVSKPPCPDSAPQDIQDICVDGWKNTRILKPHEYVNGEAKRIGNVPVLWTPTIKALWSPWVAGGVISESESESDLPLHKLRLSASGIRVSWSGLKWNLDENSKVDKETLGIPLGLGLIVDNVLIEIGKRNGSL